MKKVFSFMLIASVLVVSCTKGSRGSDDLVPHQPGVEDNPNGGGGNNIAAAPAPVQSAFASRYPNAQRIEWKKLNNGNYKVEFYIGSVKWQAIFSPAGSLLKEEHR